MAIQTWDAPTRNRLITANYGANSAIPIEQNGDIAGVYERVTLFGVGAIKFLTNIRSITFTMRIFFSSSRPGNRFEIRVKDDGEAPTSIADGRSIAGYTGDFTYNQNINLSPDSYMWIRALHSGFTIIRNWDLDGTYDDSTFGFAGAVIPVQDYAVGFEVDYTLPAADSPIPVTYALAPALPRGLAVDLVTRKITGTPAAAAASREYTWTATDDTNTAELKFNLEVVAQPLALVVEHPAAEVDIVPDGFDIEYIGAHPPPVIHKAPIVQPDLHGAPQQGLEFPPAEYGRFVNQTIILARNEPASVLFPYALGLNNGMAKDHRLFTPGRIFIAGIPGITWNGKLSRLEGTPTQITPRTELWFNVRLADGTQRTQTVRIYVEVRDAVLEIREEHDAPEVDITVESFDPPQITTEDIFMPAAEVVAIVSDRDFTDASPDPIVVPAPVVEVAVVPFDQLEFATGVFDQEWRQRQTDVSLLLPTAVGGKGQLGYRLIGTLPEGVALNPRTRLITGTPTAQFPKTNYRWVVTDEDGNTAKISFSITVLEPDIAPVVPELPETTFYTGEDNSYILPEATGGNGVITYTMHQLVGGNRRVEIPSSSTDVEQVVFDPATRVLSLSPTVVAQSILLEYTAEDEDGDRIRRSFIFFVTYRGDDTQPAFEAAASIADQVWEADSTIPPIQLPLASGGNEPLRYRFSPALPAGVMFDRDNHVVSGTPLRFQAEVEYSFIVEDANDDAAILQFDVRITEPDVQPEWPTNAAITNQRWTTGVSIGTITLPEGRGGNGALTYALNRVLPDGIVFNHVTRELSGTPTAPFASQVFRYTATDRDGDEIFLGFSVIVPDTLPTFGSNVIRNQRWTVNRSIGTITLPIAMDGNEPHTYELIGLNGARLPAGIVFDPVARTLTGTPTSFIEAGRFEYKTIDADGDEQTLTFLITVPDLMPAFPSGSMVVDQVWDTNVAIRRIVLPRATGGNGNLVHSLSPTLPRGVSVDLANHSITGTPTALFAAREFVWQARDEDGDTVEIRFSISVPDKVPVFQPGASLVSRSYFAGDAITRFTMPRAIGGNPPLRHVVTPPLPAGLALDQQALVVSGTPRFQTQRTEYEYYAVDNDGSESSRLSFFLEVEEKPILFVSTDIPVQRWIQNEDESIVFPVARGGDGTPITYSVSFNPLIRGVTFDPERRELSGQPERPGTFRGNYIARNESGSQATIPFLVVVLAEPQPTYECFTSVDNTNNRTLIKAQETVTTDKTSNPEQETTETPVDPPVGPPVDPTGQAMVSGFRVIGQFRQFLLEWENITLPTGVTFPPWEVQVSDTGVTSDPWYALRNDGVDWKGAEDTATVISTGFYNHFVGRDQLTLYYRVRFSGGSAWSESFSATTSIDIRPPENVSGFQVTGQGWSNQLDWDTASLDSAQVRHWEIQVSAGANGPWYGLVNGGVGVTGWRGVQDEWTEQTANYYTHFALPIRGTEGRPVTITLYYRIRAVSVGGFKSDWTDGSHNATAMGITKGDLGANVVDAYNVDPENFIGGLKDDTLIAWWAFDESGASGIVTDCAGKGNDLEINQSRRPTTRQGVAFRAFEFPSSSYAVTKSSLSVLNTSRISVSCWIDLDSYAGTAFNWRGVQLGFLSGNRVFFAVGSARIELSVTGLTGSWHHFCGTWDGGSDIHLYIDGIQQEGGGGSGRISGSNTVTVGALDGAIDELRVYNKALSIAEVRFLTLVPGGPSDGLVIADKLIAKSITAREIQVDALEGLIAELRQLVLTGRAGTEVRGRTIRTGDIETFVDNDQFIQYRALRNNPTSLTHWEILTQLRSFGRESELEMWDRATGRNIVFNKNGINISGGTSGVRVELLTAGELEIRLSSSRYIRMQTSGLRMQHDSDTYVTLDHANGLRIYDGSERVDMDAQAIRIQDATTRFVNISPSGGVHAQSSSRRQALMEFGHLRLIFDNSYVNIGNSRFIPGGSITRLVNLTPDSLQILASAKSISLAPSGLIVDNNEGRFTIAGEHVTIDRSLRVNGDFHVAQDLSKGRALRFTAHFFKTNNIDEDDLYDFFSPAADGSSSFQLLCNGVLRTIASSNALVVITNITRRSSSEFSYEIGYAGANFESSSLYGIAGARARNGSSSQLVGGSSGQYIGRTSGTGRIRKASINW